VLTGLLLCLWLRLTTLDKRIWWWWWWWHTAGYRYTSWPVYRQPILENGPSDMTLSRSKWRTNSKDGKYRCAYVMIVQHGWMRHYNQHWSITGLREVSVFVFEPIWRVPQTLIKMWWNTEFSLGAKFLFRFKCAWKYEPGKLQRSDYAYLLTWQVPGAIWCSFGLSVSTCKKLGVGAGNKGPLVRPLSASDVPLPRRIRSRPYRGIRRGNQHVWSEQPKICTNFIHACRDAHLKSQIMSLLNVHYLGCAIRRPKNY